MCRSGDAAGRASAMSQRRFCGGGPRRIVQNQAFCRTGRPRRTVLYRKRPRSVREAHLSAAAARAEVTATQVRRKARHRTARHSRHHTARQLPDTHEARTIQARSTHDTGTKHARYRHGQAEANTWARAAKGQHFAAHTERTRRVSIYGENGYFCI